MSDIFPPFIRHIFPSDCHEKVLLVGGSVRDHLLGEESRDIDLVAALSHTELLTLGFRRVEAKTSAPIYFRHHSEHGKIEVTRLDDISHLPDNLGRRDFTINAIALNLAGILIDPLNGSAAVKDRILIACSNTAFIDDPIRIFRAFRFAANGWNIAADTSALITKRHWEDEFRSIPVERFSQEMLKALSSGQPERYFAQMLQYAVGAGYLPELFRLPEIPAGPPEYHPEGDLYSHSVQVLQRVAAITDEPLPRFCAFFHDIGKLATDPAHYPKHHGHDMAGFTLAEEFANRLFLPANYRKTLAWVSRLHGTANKWRELRDSTKVTMALNAVKAGIEAILPQISLGDKPGGISMTEWEASVQVAKMTTIELGIDTEKLEAMPVEQRPPFILQKRVDRLRGA